MFLGFILFVACNVAHVAHTYFKNQFQRLDVVEIKTTINGHHLNVWTGGNGDKDPLLILHGFGGDALFTWSRNIPSLAKNRPIVVPDLLWFGGSKSDAAPTLETQILAMRDLMVSLGHEKYDIMGLSYGGLIAISMAMKYPDSVDQLIIVDSPGPHFNSSDIIDLTKRYNVSSVQDIFIPSSPNEIQRLINLCFYQDKGPTAPPFLLKQLYERSFKQNRSKRTELMKELLDEQRRESYLNHTFVWPKSMIVWGSEDRVIPLSRGIELSETLKGKLVVIPKGGHAPNIEHSKQFNATVLNFLD